MANINVGFADKLIETESIPINIKKALAEVFIRKIDLKAAKKRAEKGDKKDLDRYTKLKTMVDWS